MPIIGGLFALAGNFLGKLANLAVGWAGILLFGRVPQSKQMLLTGITLGSLAWIASLVGILVPDVGTFLLAFVPRPDFIPEVWVRLAMLAVALILPLAIGVASLRLIDTDRRPKGVQMLLQVLRGYPYAAALATTVAFLAVIAIVRKARSLSKRWEDAHIPVIVKPGGYERVVADLEDTLDLAGVDVRRERAPRVLTVPPRLLGAVGGAAVRGLVPDELVQLIGDGVEVLIYPSEVSIVGTKHEVARARAAIAARLTHTEAYLTAARETQEIEDRLTELGERPTISHADFAEIDDRLASLVVPHEDWETLYRLRLQVENERRPNATSAKTGPVHGDSEVGDRDALPRRSWVSTGGAMLLVTLFAADLILAVADRLTPLPAKGR